MMKLLRQRETGAPVVDGDRNLLGFVSEYDLLSWHADYIERIGFDEGLLDPVRYSRELERLPVASIMSSPAIAIESEAPLAAAVEIILEHSLVCLPVTSNGRLVGAVDRFDILEALSARDAHLAGVAHEQ
jgi:CBS domain-containing protein